MRSTSRWLVLIVVACVTGCRDTTVAPTQAARQELSSAAARTGGVSTAILAEQGARTPSSAALSQVEEDPSAPPTALAGILDVGSGANYSCALRDDGLVMCWGSNGFGNLGNGSLVGSNRALEVSGSVRFARLEVGDANACGLTTTGAAFCWGDNSSGQLGTGSVGGNSTVPVAVGGGLLFTQLSIGLRSICGVATDGVSYCWGANNSGQLGIGVLGGNYPSPQPVVSSSALGFVEVTAGFLHSCALTAAGAAYCWGAGGSTFGNGVSSPASYMPTPAANGMTFASIDMGYRYVCARDASNAGWCWGEQPFGQAGAGTFSPLLSPTAIVGTFKFGVMDAHHSNSVLGFTCGLDTAGRAFCWGSNDKGQLGTPGASSCTFSTQNFNCSARPRRVPDGRLFTRLGVGLNHSCAVQPNGEVYCWGDNAAGQLGDGSRTSSSTPVQVVRLNAPPQNGSVVVTPLAGQLLLTGSTVQFQVQALDEDGVPLAVQPTFQWVSSDPAVATVDANGLATAVATGGAIITARMSGGPFGRANLGVQIQDPVTLFQRAWSGAFVGINTTDGLVVYSGLLGDEWTHSGTFPTRREVDERRVTPSNSQVAQFYNALDFARYALEFEEARLQGVAPRDPRRGELLTLAGYTYLGFAEAFCSGVPLLDPNVGLTTTELFQRADASFAQARTVPIQPTFATLSYAGTARARLGIGDYSAAEAAAAMVPAGFLYVTPHSSTLGNENLLFALNQQQRRISMADGKGINGLGYRSAMDPRLPWVAGGFGFDGQTPVVYYAQKFPTVSSPVTVASYVETRLITAEARLGIGDIANFLATLNALRAIQGLPPLLDPGSPAARVDLLFAERAFWLFASGTRLGDMRRLIAHHGRTESTVFPTGPYPRPGPNTTYGTDANLPVPTAARGPTFSGCTDRSS